MRRFVSLRRVRSGLFALLAALTLGLPTLPAPGQEEPTSPSEPTVQRGQSRSQDARRPTASRLEVYVHSFRYRDASLAANMVRHKLSPRGTLEVQPSANTLVVRDIASILTRIKPELADFDRPPAEVRLELRVVKAGPRQVVSPPAPGGPELPPEILDKLRSLLRYDSYRVLAEAAVSSLEGESVDYSLGPDYSVSFTVGSLMAQRRLHMEDFRIVERLSSDKGRGLDPKQLFHADLNLWMDRPFTLVLTRDDTRQEALLVAITGHVEEQMEGSSPDP
ncbi:MAG: hypothetical protein MPN21_10335 [Thermoanaerobaculia bacterium]|nr:hypothetical protein [Thermoanaerobaculia bacterium]